MNAEKQAQACNIFAKIQDQYTDHHSANGQILPADMPYFVSDLLADLRHFCDAYGIDFAECDSRAHGHYLSELETA